MRPQVAVVTVQGRDNFSESDAQRLEEVAEVAYFKADSRMPLGELHSLLADADLAGMTPRAVPMIDEDFIAGLPRLRGLSLFATGVDMVDVAALTRRGVILANLPDYSTISVAEHALGLMLSMSRRIHLSSDRVRGRVPAGTSVRGSELFGKTLGLIGLGRIGSRVAKFALGLDMQVLGFDLREISISGVESVSLEELLERSDWISLHQSREWGQQPPYGADFLARMKPGATLINVARASLVDRQAIIDSIRARHLRGYAVDDAVFSEQEAGDLIREGRILQTGHTAWYSTEVIERGYAMLLDNLYHLALGRPINAVNPEVLNATHAR